MQYIISYSGGNSIVPDAIYLSADEVAHILASPKTVSRSRVWDYIYTQPRQYRVVDGKNEIYITPTSVEEVIAMTSAKLREPSKRPDFEVVAAPFLTLCESLRDYKRMTCDNIIGVITSSKI